MKSNLKIKLGQNYRFNYFKLYLDYLVEASYLVGKPLFAITAFNQFGTERKIFSQ